jgi:hypothetical protein
MINLFLRINFHVTETKEVSSFIADLKHEDQAIKEVVVLDLKGRRVALSTPIQVSDIKAIHLRSLVINNTHNRNY